MNLEDPDFPEDEDTDKYYLPAELVSFAVRLADEGIPVNVIGRAFKQPAENVRNSLHDALQSGSISEMPPPDWPPTAKRSDRQPYQTKVPMDEDTLLLNCMKVFKVTRLQASVLVVLLKKEHADKETLHSAVERRRRSRQQPPGNMDETGPKLIDVVICHLRKRLKKVTPEPVLIKTTWGSGYYIEKAHRKRAFELIDARLDNPDA